MTTAVTNPYQFDPVNLANLWKDEMVRRLTKVAIDAIRPAIELEARTVVAELEPVLKQHFDHVAGDMIFELKIVAPKEPNGR